MEIIAAMGLFYEYEMNIFFEKQLESSRCSSNGLKNE